MAFDVIENAVFIPWEGETPSNTLPPLGRTLIMAFNMQENAVFSHEFSTTKTETNLQNNESFYIFGLTNIRETNPVLLIRKCKIIRLSKFVNPSRYYKK